MCDIEISGYQATGLTLVKESGKMETIKHDTNATKFLADPAVQTALAQDLQTIIGHCRFPTKGDVKFKENNHPFVYGSTIIVHQGVLSNDEEIKKKYKFEPEGETDSWIIVHLIEMYRKQGKSVIDAICATQEELNGSWAVALVDIQEPDKVYLFCHSKTFNVKYYPEEQIFMFSTESFKLNKFDTEVTSHFGWMEEARKLRVADVEVKSDQCLVLGGADDVQLWNIPEPIVKTFFGKKHHHNYGNGYNSGDEDWGDGWEKVDGRWKYVGEEDRKWHTKKLLPANSLTKVDV